MMTYRDVLLCTLLPLVLGIPILWLSATYLWPFWGWSVVVPTGFYEGMGAGLVLVFVTSVISLHERRNVQE